MYPDERDRAEAGICRSMGGEREGGEEVKNNIPMTAAKGILRCSKTASNIAFRAELGMYSLKTNRDTSKLK